MGPSFSNRVLDRFARVQLQCVTVEVFFLFLLRRALETFLVLDVRPGVGFLVKLVACLLQTCHTSYM